MTKIRVLDAEVVKRIAAGETLQRPVNAVKELIENSLDAGATRITVHVTIPINSSSTETSAGLFSLQVTDNGTGISKDDLELLCERHATSKLVEVGDLRRVGTFGFRGEALASCSQVARVEVITRSRETFESCEVAWKASYVAGKLCGEATPVAGNFGTIINVKDLFYANRVRREALLNSSEEYQKIVQVIQSYALSQSGRCAFILTKRRDRVEMQTSLSESVGQVVKNLWNEEIGGALLPFKIESDGRLGIENGSGGWATRTTFHKLKSPQVIIFLNGRLIEHAVIRRALLQSFSMHLPTSPPAHPFIYLKLELKGSRVDVNVHPSKKQVFFLDEEEIVRRVIKAVDEGILQRQYETQSLKPIVLERTGSERERVDQMNRVDGCKKLKVHSVHSNAQSSVQSNAQSNVQSIAHSPAISKISSLNPSQRILTDHRNHRIDTFLFHTQSQSAECGGNWSQVEQRKENKRNNVDNVNNVNNANNVNNVNNVDGSLLVTGSSQSDDSCSGKGSVEVDTPVDTKVSVDISVDTSDTSLIITGNTSIIIDSQSSQSQSQSKSQSQSQAHAQAYAQDQDQDQLLLSSSNDQLCRLLQSSLPVGLIDFKWCLLQSGTNLLLCDMDRLNYDLFFSLLASETRKRDKFEVEIGVRGLFGDGEIGGEAVEVIKRNCQFFSDKFGIIFNSNDSCDDIILLEIPSVLPGQRCPSKRFLETFIQRLCLITPVDMQLSVLREMAQLYSLIDTEEWTDWEDYVKFVLLTGYRDPDAKFTMRNGYSNDNDKDNLIINCDPPVQIIIDTETLYKSFERC